MRQQAPTLTQRFSKMTSQRLLKLLVIATFAMTAAALYQWRLGADAASASAAPAAIGAAIATLLVAVISPDTRPRVVLRFLSALLALIAVIAFASDWSAAPIGGVQADSKSLLDHLNVFAPRLVAAIKASVTRGLGETAWDPVLTSVLNLPLWFLSAALAASAGWAGRPRRDVQIFVN